MFGWSAALPDPAENALAKKISAYWYSFAISPKGDPNPTSGTHTKWPEFTAVSQVTTTTAPSNLGSDRTMPCALARRAVL
eukprot:COSAG04_NODE_4772_length_1900_cov_1.004442_1_plen_80_part_00